MMYKKFLAVTFTSLLMSASFLSSASASEFEPSAPEDLIEQLSLAADPFVTLDSMSSVDQNTVLVEIEQMGDNEANQLMNFAPSAASANYWTDLGWNALEASACVVHVDLTSCNRAWADADVASNSAGATFPAASLHNGQGDAFRHCFWNALMVKSIGLNGAMKVAGNHENIRNGPAAEKQMDLANNASGRTIGVQSTGKSHSNALCNTAARTGKLKTLK